jgi:hypothetical protein
MIKTFGLVVLLGLVTSARAQIDTELIRPELDQNDLFARAAASRLVVIGTVVRSEGASERISPELLLERLNKGTVGGGGLETIKVEEIVCRQSDFDSKAPAVDDRPQPLYLFIPFGDSDLPDGHYREVLLPNRRYLLLLTELDAAALSTKYKLDPNRIYYRGTGHNRGVIPLEPETLAGQAPKPPEVVDKFRRLCDAMRPPSPADKLGLLEKLADSGDPVLQKEAEIAKASVQASMQRTESPRQQPKDHPR